MLNDQETGERNLKIVDEYDPGVEANRREIDVATEDEGLIESSFLCKHLSCFLRMA